MINHLVSHHCFELRDSGNPKIESLSSTMVGGDHRMLLVYHLQKMMQ